MNPLFIIFTLNSAVAIIIPQINNNVDEQTQSFDPDWKNTKILVKQGVDITDHIKGVISVTANFMELIRSSNLWIDKSKFIEELWGQIEWIVYIITAPRRWGKTMNLKMFRLYSELPLNLDGSPMNRTESHSYRYFIKGEIVQDDGTIERTTETPLISMYKGNDLHLGRHPVIDMSGIGLRPSSKDLHCFRSMIGGVYEQHKRLRNYLVNLSRTGSRKDEAKSSLMLFEKFYDVNLRNTLLITDFTSAIQCLSQILFETYKSKVVILYDEHDAFIHDTFFERKKFDSDATKEFNNFLKDFMIKTFKENEYLAKAIITGVLPVQEATSISGLNNVYSSHIFSRDNMFPYYGVFQNEFDQVADARMINESTKIKASLYYDGYRIPNHLNTPMYSTYSIRGFVNKLKLDDYWQPSTLVNTVTALFQKKHFRSDISNLLCRGENKLLIVETSISYDKLKRLNFKDYKQLNGILLSEDTNSYIPEYHRDIVFSYLLSLGLLTVHKSQTSDEESVRLTVPNQEIQNILQTSLIRSLSLTYLGLEKTVLYNYMKNNDDKETLPKLTEVMSKYLRRMIGQHGFGELSKKSALLATALSHPYIGNEATTEHILFGFIAQKMQMILPLNKTLSSIDGVKVGSQVYWSDELIHHGNYLDIFIMDDNTALIAELKYASKDNYAANNVVAVFKQVMSCILFYQPYKKYLHPKFIKFLAVRVHNTTTIEAMSVTLSPEEVNSYLQTTEEYINRKRRWLQNNNKTHWKLGLKKALEGMLNIDYKYIFCPKAFNVTYNADTESYITEVSTPKPICKRLSKH